MDQSESETEYFEYLLNVPTVVKYHNNPSSVFYMDRAKWYQFKVKLDNEKMLAHLNKLYFLVQLDFADETLQQNGKQLFRKWSELHCKERLLEIDSNEAVYDRENLNIARLEIECCEEMQFSLRVNCVPTQFTLDNDLIDKSKSFFYLSFKIFSSEFDNATILDANLCEIKTFWSGLSKYNYEIDRFRVLDSEPNVACKQKYEILKTILNPSSSDSNVDEPVVEIVKRSKFFTDDNRKFVCLIQAPSKEGKIYVEKSRDYILSIKPLNYANLEIVRVCIGLELQDNQGVQAVHNWSILNQDQSLISVNLDESKLNNSVFDVYQKDLLSITLLWIPKEEIKLVFRFNYDSKEFPNCDFTSNLTIESSQYKDNLKIEKSFCMFEFVNLESDQFDSNSFAPILILPNQGFSSKNTNYILDTCEQGIQVNQTETLIEQKLQSILNSIELSNRNQCLIEQNIAGIQSTLNETIRNQNLFEQNIFEAQNQILNSIETITTNQNNSEQVIQEIPTTLNEIIRKHNLFEHTISENQIQILNQLEMNQTNSTLVLQEIQSTLNETIRKQNLFQQNIAENKNQVLDSLETISTNQTNSESILQQIQSTLNDNKESQNLLQQNISENQNQIKNQLETIASNQIWSTNSEHSLQKIQSILNKTRSNIITELQECFVFKFSNFMRSLDFKFQSIDSSFELLLSEFCTKIIKIRSFFAFHTQFSEAVFEDIKLSGNTSEKFQRKIKKFVESKISGKRILHFYINGVLLNNKSIEKMPFSCLCDCAYGHKDDVHITYKE